MAAVDPFACNAPGSRISNVHKCVHQVQVGTASDGAKVALRVAVAAGQAEHPPCLLVTCVYQVLT